MRKLIILFGTLLLAGVLVAAPRKNPPATPSSGRAGVQALHSAMKSVDPNRIRAHVKFLSDDLLEGRGTGQRGGDLAAKYIATEFEMYGLRPAGDRGSYLQNVPMIGISTQPESTVTLVLEGQPLKLKLRDDIVAMDESQNTASEVDAEVVFVGYGVNAPEYQWNDYKDADLRGKVLLLLVNEPASDDPVLFKGKALTYYGRWTYKFEEAARRGAVGALIVHKSEMASYGWDVVRNSWSGERSYLRDSREPKLQLAAWVQWEIARQMVAAGGKDLDELITQAGSREFRPVTLPVRIKAHVVSKVRPFESSNVIALLPGSDPNLKQEAVLYSAHYDHLGIRPGGDGDNIYNGAVDNATGCGILLEMARAFASAPQQPRRSVIFAAVTGEEQGLLGSEYLGKHFRVPPGRISVALNFDGVPPLGIPEEVEVGGAERTSFYPIVQATAREFHFGLVPDANPEAGHYYRSDHFSLARVGIPSFTVNQGSKFKGRSREYGANWEKEYNQKHYHQPSDEYRPEMDFRGNAVLARFGLALGWKAASQPEQVQWQPGDEFEAVRKASLSRAGKARGTK